MANVENGTETAVIRRIASMHTLEKPDPQCQDKLSSFFSLFTEWKVILFARSSRRKKKMGAYVTLILLLDSHSQPPSKNISGRQRSQTTRISTFKNIKSVEKPLK